MKPLRWVILSLALVAAACQSTYSSSYGVSSYGSSTSSHPGYDPDVISGGPGGYDNHQRN